MKYCTVNFFPAFFLATILGFLSSDNFSFSFDTLGTNGLTSRSTGARNFSLEEEDYIPDRLGDKSTPVTSRDESPVWGLGTKSLRSRSSLQI